MVAVLVPNLWHTCLPRFPLTVSSAHRELHDDGAVFSCCTDAARRGVCSELQASGTSTARVCHPCSQAQLTFAREAPLCQTDPYSSALEDFPRVL